MLSSRTIEFSQWIVPIDCLLVHRLNHVVPQRCSAPRVSLLREMKAIERQQRQIALAINNELQDNEVAIKKTC